MPAPVGRESSVDLALARLFDRLLEAHRAAHGGLPRQPYDPDWPSPCQVGEPDPEGMIEWRPAVRGELGDFSGIEHALDTPLHSNFKDYCGRYWCDSFACGADEGRLTLIQVWNQRDFDRLLENLIGHALAKRRAHLPLTLFVACTDEGDFMLSIDNASGAVVLEEPGRAAAREVASSLADLLLRVEPLVGVEAD